MVSNTIKILGRHNEGQSPLLSWIFCSRLGWKESLNTDLVGRIGSVIVRLPITCFGDMTSRTEFLVLWLPVWDWRWGLYVGCWPGGRQAWSQELHGGQRQESWVGPCGAHRTKHGTDWHLHPHPLPAALTPSSCSSPALPPTPHHHVSCLSPQTLIHCFCKRQRSIYFLSHKCLCLTLEMFSDIITTLRRTRKNSKLQVMCSTITNEICKYVKTQEIVRTEKCIYSIQRNIFGNAIWVTHLNSLVAIYWCLFYKMSAIRLSGEVSNQEAQIAFFTRVS